MCCPWIQHWVVEADKFRDVDYISITTANHVAKDYLDHLAIVQNANSTIADRTCAQNVTPTRLMRVTLNKLEGQRRTVEWL
jgi:hypothetical protein